MKPVKSMVPKAGLEPARLEGRLILSQGNCGFLLSLSYYKPSKINGFQFYHGYNFSLFCIEYLYLNPMQTR